MSAPLLFCEDIFRWGLGVAGFFFLDERPGQGQSPGDEGPPEKDVKYQDRDDLAMFADNSYNSRQEDERYSKNADDDDKRDDHK